MIKTIPSGRRGTEKPSDGKVKNAIKSRTTLENTKVPPAERGLTNQKAHKKKKKNED